MTYEEYKRKYQNKETKEVKDDTTKGGYYDRYKEKYGGGRSGNFDDMQTLLESFDNDFSAFAASAQKSSETMGYSTSSDAWKTHNPTAEKLKYRLSNLKLRLESNQQQLDETSYNAIKDYLNSADNYLTATSTYFSKNRQYYSQWDSEESYNNAMQAQKNYEEMVSLDLDAYGKEVASAEGVLEEYDSLARKVQTMATSSPEYAAATKRMAEISEQYGGKGKAGIEAHLSEKKAYMNRAKYIQEGIALAGVADPESELYDPDFASKSGYVSTKSDNWWSELTSQYGLGYDDLTYEYINNQNGIRDEVKAKDRTYSSDNPFDDGESIYEKKGYDYLYEDEIAIYNYYYAKDGKEAAEKYLDSIQETLNQRKASGMYENIENDTLKELAFGVSAGLDQFKSGMHNFVNTEDDYIPYSAYQIASAAVREDLADTSMPVWYNVKTGEWEDKILGSSVGQVAYDTITTGTNMLPSILTSIAIGSLSKSAGTAFAAKAFATAGNITGSTMLGISAAGNAYQEMLNLGYDKGQARAYSSMVGASEAGLQYLLGGIGKLGGKGSGKVLTKLLNGVDNALARTAIKLGGNMAFEAVEEGLQEILNPWFKNLVAHTDEEVNWNQVAYASLLGALTAGAMEGSGTVYSEVNTYRTGKRLQDAGISAQRLAKLGTTFSADTVAYQLAGRVNENTGAYTVGRLFNEIGASLSEQNVTDITNALVSKGVNETVARKNAEALAYVVEGGQLTDSQIAFIEANDVLAEVARTTLIDANTTWNQRSRGYNEALKALSEEVSTPKPPSTKTAKQTEENAPTADTVDTKKEDGVESVTESDTIDTSPVTAKRFSTIENGQAVIELEDGSEVSVREADLAPDEGVRIETIASIDGISTEDANFILNTLRTGTNASAQMDALGAKEVYKYGFYGFSQEHMATHGVFANALTNSQMQAIYETGKNARQQQIESATFKNTSSGKQTEIYFDNGNGNVVAFKDAKKTLTEKQTAGVQAVMILRKLGIGGDIYFFESYRNSKGQLVYKDRYGNEVKAPNGWYSESDGSIHIDLNAGTKGQGFVLFTLAHELTHFIEKWSPQKYKILADFLVENYEKGQSMDKLVRAKQDKLSEQRGKNVSYKEAYSEVVADSMEAMLADGNVVEKLIALKAKDNALFAKMKQFFDNLLNKIRNIYKGQTPDSAEGRAVMEMTDSIEKIQQLFADALVDASENFQSAEAQKNTTEDGGVKMMVRENVVDVSGNIYKKVVKPGLTIYDKVKHSKKTYVSYLHAKIFRRTFTLPTDDGSNITVEFAKDNERVKKDGDKTPRRVLGELEATSDRLKMIAIINIRDILKNSEPLTPSGENSHQWLDASGWRDRISYMMDNDTIYPVYLHIPKTRDGRYLLYDITVKKDEGSTVDIDATALATSSDSRASATQENESKPAVKSIEPSGGRVTQPNSVVNSESAKALDVEVDTKTESVAPTILKSERTWTESDYVQERENAAQEIAKAIGVSVNKAKAYIDSVNSIAKMIADDRTRLDYFSSPGRSSFVSNVEYGGSFDFSTLCKKRRLLTGTFTAIQKALPNTALTANEILDIRNRMKDAGLEVSCGLCYVEGSRANMGQFAKEFLKLYKQYYPDAWQPNMADVNTPDGIEWVRINHPEVYEQYEYFWNHYGTLKPGDKNLFASQQKPKLYQLHTEYKGEILDKFNNDENVEEKNLNGGIRLQSFSDFEIVHLIDTMQIIMDMSRVGLAGQAYTKVPDFAWALGDTGLKINLSLIAKGVDANGKLVFDDVEGMPIDTAVALRERYSSNVGTILVAFNDEQLVAAMADERVDFIIPFHRSQWKKSQYEAMGLPAKTKDYTYMQNEKYIKPQYHEYRGRMVQDKATNYMPNEYWDFSKSGKENAEAYLEMCARNNKRPKFYKLLQNNGDGSYSLKADGSTDGYWKLLIDFKMYDNNGVGSPQLAVKPNFNMDEAQRMLNEYQGGHSSFPVAQGVVDSFVNEYKDSHKDVLYSDRDNAPTFYSQMAKVVDAVKQDKLGAASVVSMLRGKGVKAEEIKWSGIEQWLAGKKSVTKAELREFIAGSMLQIEEQVRDKTKTTNLKFRDISRGTKGLYSDGKLIETFTEDEYGHLYPSNAEDVDVWYLGKEDVLRNYSGNANNTRWSEYKLDGGKNYREIVFKLPNSTYSNGAMQGHWGDNAQGIIAHARLQDFKVNGKKMLFIEEIQSDWHNEGHRSGYKVDGQKYDKDIYNESGDAYRAFIESDVVKSIMTRLGKSHYEGNVTELINELFNGSEYALDEITYNIGKLTSQEKAFIDKAVADETKRQSDVLTAPKQSYNAVPDAPFKDTYHEFVLKNLLRQAAEKDYARIGWTTADTQSQRWSDEYAEGYRIEYDQDIPKFLRKYGKQWGAEVSRITLRNGTEVWSMDITDSMKKSVLTEGQALYSDRDSSGKQLGEDQLEYFEKSTVRDRKGNLQVVYHGGTVEYEFDTTRGGNGSTQYGPGAYFTDSEYYAKEYTWYRGGDVKDYYLNIEKLFDDTNMDATVQMPQWNKLEQILRSNGIEDKFINKFKENGFAYMSRYLALKAEGGAKTSDSWEGSERLNAMLREAGFDGIKGELNDCYQYVVFTPNQAKLTTNEVPSAFYDTRYQDRDTDSVSNRSLLANAFEGLAQNDIERNKIQEYKSKVDLINAEEQKLRDLNAQIKELSFAKGQRDTQKIKDLQFEAKQTANRISTYDKQLLRLEASKPLQDVLDREKKKAYSKAEQRGKEALANYKEKAAKTQRELLERWQDSRKKGIESREKTATRRKIQSVVGELNQLLLNNDKTRHVPDSLKKAVADALSLVNMDTVGAEERAAKYAALIAKETDPDKIDAYTATMENILRQGERMGQRLKDLRDAYEEIQNSDDPDIANAYDPVIAGSLKELAGSIGNTSLRDMTKEQLSDVYDMYKMVLTRVRDANKSFLNEKKETISNLASRAVGEVRVAGGEHKYRAAILDPVKSFTWNNLKPVYAMEHIGSPTITEAFNNVRKGEDTWAKDVSEARAYYLDKSNKYGYDSWDFEKKYTFKSASGLEFDLTLEQIMSLYAYSKRNQAFDHLRLGGFVFDSNIEVNAFTKDGTELGKFDPRRLMNHVLKYKVNTADAHQITPEILANIIGNLSNEQKGFVDEMQDYLSTVMGAKGNEVTSAMYGVKLFKEQFYFPLKSAKQFMFEQNEVSGEVKIKNSGFTNKVVAKANNPVILSNFMDVWANHVNDMSMYHSFVLPLEDFNRIFNYNSPKQEGTPPVSVKGTIQSAYSPAAVSYVKQLITDLNGGAMADPRETFAKAMTAKFKKAKVFSSLSVIIQQPSSIGRAFALVDPKYFQPTKDGMRHDELWAEVKQYAPVAVIKEMGYFDTNMGKSTQDFIKAKEYSTFKDKAKAVFTDSGYRDELLSKGPALADELTWCAIWNAVKRETAAKNKDLTPGSEEFLKAAGERFTEVVTKTQVYDSVLSRSANMRSKSGLMSMVTAFMAEPTTSINMLEDAIRKGKNGYKGYAARTVASVAASVILNNALVALIYGMRDDDEDETFAEKYIQSFVSNMLDDVNPITYYPYLKDMWSLLQGYDVERSDMSLVSDLADAMKDMVKAYTSEDGDVADAWWKLAGSVANIGGIPMENIRRDVNGAINFINTIMEDVNGRATSWGSLGDSLQATIQSATPVYGWFPSESKKDKLYDAIVSGDTAYVDRLKDSYKSEDAYHSAVRQALRESDPRIKEAAIAGYNGNPSERVRIAKLIIADGFNQDDVVMAINAEINAMKPGESGSVSKEKGYYTTEDFAMEIANGDTATAKAAKADIISTYKKNGKTAEEAEKSFVSSAKSELGEMYIAGNISEQKLTDALQDYCEMDEEDIYWQIAKWDYAKETGSSDGYAKYGDFHDAVQTGKDLKAVIKEYTDHGVEAKTLASEITSHFKPLYKEMSNSERASIKGYLLNAYALLGYDRQKKSKDIDKWLED